MYILKKDITPGTVVWGEKTVYYDQPEKVLHNRKCMYVVTMVNDDYFLGCPLTTHVSKKYITVLESKYYPIKRDSKISECLYKVYYDQIVSPATFQVRPGTFEYFKRCLYKRIILDQAASPRMYNEPFVEEYLANHKPEVDNILVFPSREKVFKYYYLYDEDDNNYVCVRLNIHQDTQPYSYSLSNQELVTIPKTERYFDCYTKHPLSRETVEEGLKKPNQKTLGSRIKDFLQLK